MNILEMSAGRELDALVAEKVMGWDESQFHFDEEMGISERIEYNEFIGEDIWAPFNPSTDISAAYEMETTMQVNKLRSVLYTSRLRDVILHEKDGVNDYDLIHATPEQRCKAALLAMEGIQE